MHPFNVLQRYASQKDKNHLSKLKIFKILWVKYTIMAEIYDRITESYDLLTGDKRIDDLYDLFIFKLYDH